MVPLPCNPNHKLHEECKRKWVEDYNKNTCPVCRAPIDPDKVEDSGSDFDIQEVIDEYRAEILEDENRIAELEAKIRVIEEKQARERNEDSSNRFGPLEDPLDNLMIRGYRRDIQYHRESLERSRPRLERMLEGQRRIEEAMNESDSNDE